jgi:hypothetical protein
VRWDEEIDGLTSTGGKVGAGLAPDKETELRIRAQLDEKLALEKKMSEESRKSSRRKKKAIV